MQSAPNAVFRPLQHLAQSTRTAALAASPGGATAASIAAEIWQTVKRGLFERYRPERHYMRGPGPKWREKHGGGSYV